MNCQAFQEQVNALLDGELDLHRQMDLLQHCSTCTECRSFIEVLSRLKETQRRDEVPYPRDLDERVLSEIATLNDVLSRRTNLPEMRRSGSFWKRKIAMSMPIAAAAAVVAVLMGIVAGMFLNRPAENRFVPLSLPLTAEQPGTVIVLYSLPPVEIHSTRLMQAVHTGRPIQQEP